MRKYVFISLLPVFLILAGLGPSTGWAQPQCKPTPYKVIMDWQSYKIRDSRGKVIAAVPRMAKRGNQALSNVQDEVLVIGIKRIPLFSQAGYKKKTFVPALQIGAIPPRLVGKRRERKRLAAIIKRGEAYIPITDPIRMSVATRSNLSECLQEKLILAGVYSLLNPREVEYYPPQSKTAKKVMIEALFFEPTRKHQNKWYGTWSIVTTKWQNMPIVINGVLRMTQETLNDLEKITGAYVPFNWAMDGRGDEQKRRVKKVVWIK